jgi:hypothetical protein
MIENLIINPFAEISAFKTNESSGLDITVPVRGQAKKYFRLESGAQPELIEFIKDLTKWGFEQLRAQDLTDDERELLIENGFLIDETCAPEKPLFHFFLDELETENHAKILTDLIVNPNFRFEPFDVRKVPELIKFNNFSPEYPIAWGRLPVTEIEIGYWLRGEYAEIARKFIAGEKLNFKIGDEFLAKFVAADILIDPDEWKKREAENVLKIEKARSMFQTEKYTIFENILPGFYMRSMKKFFRAYIANGFMPFNDTQVKRRFYEHNLPLARFFHRDFTKLMSMIAGIEVKPSYVYSASYLEGAALDPHIDRPQCEYSISFQVDYQPEPKNDVSPWGLYVSPVEMADQKRAPLFPWTDYPENDLERTKSKKANLKSGDGLFYMGREMVHYRYPLAKGHTSTSLFFHYVAKDFAGDLN